MKHTIFYGRFFAAVLAIAAVSQRADAAFVYTATETAGGVTFSGQGSVNLAGLNLMSSSSGGVSALTARVGYLLPSGVGPAYGGFTGPSGFGQGGSRSSSSQAGDRVGISVHQNLILLPAAYVSGAQLSSSLTFAGATFASLGLDRGTYVYGFGSGADADTFTVQIGGAVPEPAAWAMMMAGFGAIGAGLRSRRRTVIRYA